MFILFPVEGLANRLRAIDSAIRYCESHNINNYKVKWHSDLQLCNCRWNDVFSAHKHIVNDRGGYKRLQFIFKLKRHSSLFCKFLSLLERSHLLAIFGPDDWNKLRETVKSGKRYLWMIVESFSIFYWTEEEPFRKDLFILNDEMQKRLDKEKERCGDNVIGVHIRRTDNKVSIEQSPLELFEERMRQISYESPDVRFYLCSDDEQVKERIKNSFDNGRVICPQGVLERNTTEGIKQAITELYMLSSTRYILGSFFSSFSEMASYLGDIPLVQIRK